MKAISN